MCDTPSEYKHGDTVWVKLGNCWWPGEATDFDQLEESVKEDLQSTSRGKLPFAIVKFFQEDSYEYVKKDDKIFPYNCSKKDEFIKKGMDMHRAKKSHMEKFPEDVVIAEKRTNGDENILNDEKFAPPSKIQVKVSEIFGTPKVKYSPKPAGRSKGTPTQISPKKTPMRFVTHPRFIGKRNDHKRIVLVQQKKDEITTGTYKCPICKFTATRVDAIALHTKTHLKNDPLFNDKRKKIKKRAPKKTKIPSSKTNSIEEDLALLDKGMTLFGGEITDADVPEKKKRRKRKRAAAPAVQEEQTAKKAAPDITNDLLAEWDDGDEEDDDTSMNFDGTSSILDSTTESVDASPKNIKETKVVGAKAKTPVRQTPKASSKVKDKAVNAKKTPKEQENGSGSVKKTAEKLDLDFNALLETTKVPELPNLPKTDEVKVGAKSPEIATKLTNPKKRFVKSFEDFELSMKEKQQELAKEVSELLGDKCNDDDSNSKIDEPKLDDVKPQDEDKSVVAANEEEKKKPVEEKKQTRRSSRFDKEKLPEKEPEPEKPQEETETKKEEVAEDKKSTRRSSLRVEKDKPEEETVEEEPKDVEKKPRRSSTRIEPEKEKPVEDATNAEKEKEPEKKEEIDDKKSITRRGSTRGTEKFDKPEEKEKVEPRKSGRRSEIPPKDEKKSKKDEAKTESESDTNEEITKKSKDEQKDAKPDEKSKKESKSLKVDEKITKKDDEKIPKKEDEKTKKETTDDAAAKSTTGTSTSTAKKEEKVDKTDKKSKPAEKPKPKEKLLFEIDVFGSLRAQENEKYNKKSEDSPRRETRASRSKSHSDDKKSDAKTPAKRPKKDEGSSDDAQVNNGKNDDSTSPLISKMKNKLMNKLAEPLETTPGKQKTPTRSKSSDDEKAKDTKKREEKKSKRQRGHSSSNEDVEMSDGKSDDDKKVEKSDLKGHKGTESRESRRDSLRGTSSTALDDKKEKKLEESGEKSVIFEEKIEKKTVATKAEMKSPTLTKNVTGRPSGGPKTYLRSSRADKSESGAVKSPLGSPTRSFGKSSGLETVEKETTEKLEETSEKETAKETKEEVKLTGEALLDHLSKIQSPQKTGEDDSSGEWLKTLSPLKKKLISTSTSSNEDAKSKPDVSPVKEASPQKEIKETKPLSPTKTLKSPVKPLSPTKPMSPNQTPTSPIKTSPLSPAKSPIGSPLRQSPMKSPPIILNKDASKFDPGSQLKKTPKREESAELAKLPSVKSPRRISLSSQEVSITDKSITSNNNEGNNPPTSEVTGVLPVANATADPLDLLASVSTSNKDAIEKNITVVPEDILADGQVEIAKIIEDGTEKIASIPTVIAEKADDAIAASENVPEPAEEVGTPQKPIILNSRLSADQESTSKLLDILSDNKRPSRPAAAAAVAVAKAQQVPLPKIATPKFDIDAKKPAMPVAKPAGRILAGGVSPSTSKSKPTILSDTLIRPADSIVSVQKVKRTYDDIEDIDAFIITKHAKKDEEVKKPVAPAPVKSKPKILEHTIITASGQVIQPLAKTKKPAIIQQQTIKVPSGSAKTVEEKVYDLLNSPKSKDEDTFDIDNMPIVMDDQLLTSDNIEALPVVVSEPAKPAVTHVIRKPQQQIKPIPKQIVATAGNLKGAPVSKTYTKLVKGQRGYQTTPTTAPTILKHQPTILATGKQGKFVIVPSQSTAPPGTKYTVGKRPLAKKQPAILAQPKAAQQQAVASPEPSGNKIMIVTNNQGQQQRVWITPEQQKLMGYSTQTKKTIMRASPSPAGKERKIIATSAAGTGGLIAVKRKIESGKATQQKVGAKFSLQGSMPPSKGPGQMRTVIIKNQQGEVVNKIHGTSDEDIEKQVTEQLVAITRAANKNKAGTSIKRVIKKAVPAASVSDTTRTAIQNKALNSTPVVASSQPQGRTNVPPLAPITPTKKGVEPAQQKQVVRQQKGGVTTVSRIASAGAATANVAAKPDAAKPAEKKEDRPPKQLVIQDAMGNETTIMEGQILALPSETVDGQPQSYMLVTLDESGSLTPLNNEALMSLDPNLNLGGDLSNMVLQIEGSGANTEAADTTTTTQATTTKTTPMKQPAVQKTPQVPIESKQPEIAAEPEIPQQVLAQEEPQAQTLEQLEQLAADPDAPAEQIHAITCSINKGDTTQNLIITGDPVATQKFLESLTEGNPEIANLLAHVEGQNILIHTDGQQILINSDVDSNVMMNLNHQLGVEATEESGQIYASQAKNQDILAAALADTDVFQQEQTVSASKMTQSQLSPGYPMAVNNVLETSTVNSPIMTPLEVPSANAKIKESDVLNQQVPKNVDLPITITDPNIAHSVANQQVNLLPAELGAGMELPLTIQDIPTTSAGISSPSFYSLPSLDDGEKFTSPISMPLLTEDPEEVQAAAATTDSQKSLEAVTSIESSSSGTDAVCAGDADDKVQDGTAEYLLATGDMCTISNQISSLSEPPPDMFDFPVEQAFSSSKTDFCNSSEQLTAESDINAASILAGKSPKRVLHEEEEDASTEDTPEDNKRAKLD